MAPQSGARCAWGRQWLGQPWGLVLACTWSHVAFPPFSTEVGDGKPWPSLRVSWPAAPAVQRPGSGFSSCPGQDYKLKVRTDSACPLHHRLSARLRRDMFMGIMSVLQGKFLQTPPPDTEALSCSPWSLEHSLALPERL